MFLNRQERRNRVVRAEKCTWNLSLFTLRSSLSENSCCKASGEEKGLSPGSWAMHSYLGSEQQGVVCCWDCWWTSIPASTNGFLLTFNSFLGAKLKNREGSVKLQSCSRLLKCLTFSEEETTALSRCLSSLCNGKDEAGAPSQTCQCARQGCTAPRRLGLLLSSVAWREVPTPGSSKRYQPG